MRASRRHICHGEQCKCACDDGKPFGNVGFYGDGVVGDMIDGGIPPVVSESSISGCEFLID